LALLAVPLCPGSRNFMKPRLSPEWFSASCRTSVIALLAGWLTIPALATARASSATHLKVPDGYIIERVAGPPQIRFPMFGAFDEQGRLFVTESSGGDLYDELRNQKRTCRISVLEDRDGDGIYEHARVFAEQLVPSMGLAWLEGKLFVADPPDLITLEDTNGDGVADLRTVLLTGFGHTDNGSLHGLIFGPDGWLYMTMGWPDGYQLQHRDGPLVSGNTGALIRCRPDGAQPEVLARGFDQLVELIFLAGGEMIGTQCWYQNPSEGMRDSLTHLLPGGLYPQRWADERPRPFATGPEALPPLLLMPAVAHSGLAFHRGGILPDQALRVFSAEFNTRKVVCHTLTREGATFRAEPRDFITTDDPDFRPSDVLEDADGSLIVIDTGSWYVQHCPTGRMRKSAAPGAIYRARRAGAPPLPDPRGQDLVWEKATTSELGERLLDSRPFVRDRAAEALVNRGNDAIGPLKKVAHSPGAREESRAAAVWALARVGGPASLRELRALLRATNPTVLSAVCRALAAHGDLEAAQPLEELLRHAEPCVRLAAAEALAVCGNARTSAGLLEAMTSAPDRMLEHAIIYALHRTARAIELRDALNHAHPLAQKAAMLVLAQEPHRLLLPADVLARLTSDHEPLRLAAQFCLRLRPDWAEHAVAFVQAQLRENDLSADGESALMNLLGSLRNDKSMELTLVRAFEEPDDIISVSRKLSLLELIGRSEASTWSAGLRQSLTAALVHPSAELRLRAVRTIAVADADIWETPLRTIARDPAEDLAVRVEALASLVQRDPALDPELLALLSARLGETNSALARIRAAEVMALSRPSEELLRDLLRAAELDPAISPNHVVAAARRGQFEPALLGRLLRYLAGSIERGWAVTRNQLDPLLQRVTAEAQAQADELERAVRTQSEQQQALLLEYEPLLTGGDPARGRQIFFGAPACASCHRVGREGVDNGPDLTKLGAIRSGLDILESVLLPSATFAQGYDTYLVELKDGDSVTGMLSHETPDTVVLRISSGAELRVPRKDVLAITKSAQSTMPEGLLQLLTREEVADLLAFLQGLK
jgi:putative membrane-bound dehydrogenase-like protein